jgi:dihydroorotase
MSKKRWILKGGKIASEKSSRLVTADVLVEGTTIKAVGREVPAEGAKVIDCEGKILLPALFDSRVHLREPGREDKETITSGAAAAVNGGFTGIVAMPNTNPPIDTAAMVRFVRSIASEVSPIPVYPAGCLSKGQAGKELAEIADMVEKGAVLITDDDRPVANPYLLRRAMEYSRNFDIPIGCHCGVPELSEGGSINEGLVSYRLGMTGIPAASEEIGIDRDIRIARMTGAAIHIHHVSTAEGMETIRRYKNEGVNVTCEVTPHHLIFCENDITNYNTHFKMSPPLRTEEDRERLIEGLIEGVFDIMATDHAPHTVFEKDLDFAHAPFGITGLETALPSLYSRFIKTKRFGWDVIVKHFSANPRRLFNCETVELAEGKPAEIVVFDPKGSTTIDRDFLKSKSDNTPFLGQTLDGRIDQLLYRGKLLLDRKNDV